MTQNRKATDSAILKIMGSDIIIYSCIIIIIDKGCTNLINISIRPDYNYSNKQWGIDVN